MCGDSTAKETVALLMNGEKADMVFTDPPYGVSYEGGLNEKKKAQIKNDALKGNTLYTFLCDVFRNLKASTKDKSAIYIFYATKTTREFINAFDDAGLKQRGIIAWYKKGGGFGDFMAHYMNAYEPCIYGSNGESVNWYGLSNEKTVWEIDKEKKCDLHPTMKPIAVVARAINNSSRKGDAVLDLFGGSGSTLIACEQLNRRCFMMELDPKYCDVIIKRWETLTGKKAELLKGE
jgi:DNA modification methylase